MSSTNPKQRVFPNRTLESYPLQHITRKDTTSTVSTTSTSATNTSSSTTSTASRAKNALQHLAQPLSRESRARIWHSLSTEDTKRREIEGRVREDHKQNLYTDCGRHGNEWLFSGWGDLTKWALGRDRDERKGRDEFGERKDGSRTGSLEEIRGRAPRRDDQTAMRRSGEETM